jgi:hypothetical protein
LALQAYHPLYFLLFSQPWLIRNQSMPAAHWTSRSRAIFVYLVSQPGCFPHANLILFIFLHSSLYFLIIIFLLSLMILDPSPLSLSRVSASLFFPLIHIYLWLANSSWILFGSSNLIIFLVCIFFINLNIWLSKD